MDNTLIKYEPQLSSPGTKAEEAVEERTFITANTIPVTLQEISDHHTIPVFRDNETVISHVDFIEAAQQVVSDTFYGQQIARPLVRVSHPIKGRSPEAKDKPANELLEHEKTIWYERMMFVIEIPGIVDTVNGNTLSLCVGGVKAYNEDNLYSRSISDQHFKVFIGFQNKVCTNMCVTSTGYVGDLKVKNREQLYAGINNLVTGYQAEYHLNQFKQLSNHSITEAQFAQVIGRCRLYNFLPGEVKKEISPLLFNDSQISAVCRDYYRDESFCKQEDGSINLWRMYNLLTGVNKSSYIDSFLDRSVNAYNFVEQLRCSLDGTNQSWYLS